MKKIAALLVLIGVLSCEKQPYHNPSKENIDEVVLEAFYADYFAKIFERDELPFDRKLVKLQISTTDSVFSHSSRKINIKNLLNIEYDKNKIFSSKDSAYLLFQNNIFNDYSISKTTHKDVFKFKKENPLFPIGRISIPIFSLDQNYAYVQISHGGNGLGGGGFYVILRKTREKWYVIKTTTLWDS
jgi:hypothetical protein